MRTFTFTEGTSNKFWNISREGTRLTVQFGRIGSAGQTQIKDFDGEVAAQKEHDKLVAEKVKKGYTETTAAKPTPAPVETTAAKPATKATTSKKAATPEPVAAAMPKEAPTTASVARTFEFSDATSHKFWNIERTGTSLTINFGRIGSAGQTQVKSFTDEAKAEKEFAKLVAEKSGKGYRETTPVARPAPTNMREALEEALIENPDDLASHMAYADYLAEQGDPYGEFIRVQLALEEESRTTAERKTLQGQEKKLLARYQKDWFGEELSDLLFTKLKKQPGYGELKVECTLRRGWIDTLEIHAYTVAISRLLAQAAPLRLLRRLVLVNNAYEGEGNYPPGPDIPEDSDSPQLFPLARCPYLGNVRQFTLGEMPTQQDEDSAHEGSFNSNTQGDGVMGMIKQMTRLEELRLFAQHVDPKQLFSLKTLSNLRVLQVYHERDYPLAALAKNPSLSKLTHLLLHPHAMDDEVPYIRTPGIKAVVTSPYLKSLTHLQLRLSDTGDRGVKEIIDSGVLARLKVLDMRHGRISDAGAKLFAACPDAKKLERLDLMNNNLTKAGIATLKEAGVQVSAPNQWTAGGGGEWSDGDQEYLFAGDIE